MSLTLAFVSEDAYHRDDVIDVPTLSASIAHTLVTSSPKHAWAKHPKLNPAFERKAEERFDLGNAVHSFFLEGTDNVHAVDAPNWTTKIAKEERAHAREIGKIPLLLDQLASVNTMIAAIREQLAEHRADPPLFQDGAAEQTLVWDEDGVKCRARLDWLRHDLVAADDLKTTGRSADPAAYSRALFGVGGDVQAAFYLRGVRALTSHEPVFRWCVVETSPPYALSVIQPSAELLALGNDKVDRAIATWRKCLAADEWPAYPNTVTRADAPAWEVERWLVREEMAV